MNRTDINVYLLFLFPCIFLSSLRECVLQLEQVMEYRLIKNIPGPVQKDVKYYFQCNLSSKYTQKTQHFNKKGEKMHK